MESNIKTLNELIQNTEPSLKSPPGWEINAIQSQECISYIAWNTNTKEALIVDPKIEDESSYENIIRKLDQYRWIGIFDTHTHADHVSLAAKLSARLNAPLIMHHACPSHKPQMKVFQNTALHSQAGKIRIWVTPGHTPDSITIAWGPYLFAGDLILFGDTGRDDLPGGDAASHFESLELIKREAESDLIMLPGHDQYGGRASSLKHQLQINASLIQKRDDFIREAEAFDAPAPSLLKRSLKENFK